MTELTEIPDVDDAIRIDCDVLVIGGGTAGTMAALTAAENGAQVLLLEKAHVRHSGALAMGMDGVNNAVIPGKAEPEDYVAEITRANDGIVNQRTVYQTATRGFAMVQRLERYGVKFEKDEHGEYAVRRVHRSGSYVLPMPEGKDVKKALYRVLRQRSMREKIRIENRFMPVRVLTDRGRAVGAVAFNIRTGEFVTVAAKAVILSTGACGRLGLPASGYLYGTYENPTNAGDGYAIAGSQYQSAQRCVTRGYCQRQPGIIDADLHRSRDCGDHGSDHSGQPPGGDFFCNPGAFVDEPQNLFALVDDDGEEQPT